MYSPFINKLQIYYKLYKDNLHLQKQNKKKVEYIIFSFWLNLNFISSGNNGLCPAIHRQHVAT